MAEEISRYFPDQTLDIRQLLQEASHRWFRPPEICEILSNHTKYYVNPESPVKPPAGSLYLFDRKVLRFFRKDGYNWRKKKDGKTVKEAHEKLKVGGVDVLHCYYAHGEENENFQRRIYWMLDTQFDHIVLVHYREVNEGPKIGSHFLTAADPGSQLGSPKTSSESWSEQSSSPFQASFASNHNTVYCNDHGLPSKFGDRNSGVLGAASVIHPIQGSVADDTLLPMNDASGFDGLRKDNIVSGINDGSYIPATSSFWADVHGSSKALSDVQNQKLHFNQLIRADFLSRKLVDATLEVDKVLQNVSTGKDGLFIHTQGVVQVLDSPIVAPESSSLVAGLAVNEAGELKKLDSFGRWMDREIGGDCDESLMASDSTNYLNTLDTANDDREVSILSRHMQLDTDFLESSLSQQKRFSISDFAPDWAYPGVETNVLVTGAFLGDKKVSDGHKWCCMFGEIEVSCEVVSDYMIRCQVPCHAPGRVPFYVTCGNRLSCSEMFEFEYRKNLLKMAPLAIDSDPEELSVQIRLAKMLCLGLDRKWLYCSAVECEKCNLKRTVGTLLGGVGEGWAELEDVLIEVNSSNFKDTVIQNLLKDKLYEWLVCKAHDGNKGPHVLDDDGQGIIHLAASLGYIWAFGPIIASGVSPNFRDKQGRTSLHWASYYKREEAVITLIKLGAAAGAVDDPRPEFPGGQTAADLASARGHRGIAAYLAEAVSNYVRKA
ncbi:hypothetical protein ACJIZ3_013495 [Penstemon smallii]|uniref:CG-1 domain-containing protein n=1 Tax=Penstemon smallii TaxID=265156 RepID=A0ABD3RIT4_9LAMI